MNAVTVTTAVALTAAFATLGSAKVMKTSLMLAKADHVGFSARSYQLIGAAELAGSAGVLGGLWFAPVGYAAGAGLVALLTGALVTHARRGDVPADLAPACFFVVATAFYLVCLGVGR